MMKKHLQGSKLPPLEPLMKQVKVGHGLTLSRPMNNQERFVSKAQAMMAKSKLQNLPNLMSDKKQK